MLFLFPRSYLHSEKTVIYRLQNHHLRIHIEMPYSHLTIHLSPRTPRGGLDLHRDARAAAVPLELQSPTGRFGGARKITHSPPGPPPSSPCPQPVPLLPSRLRSAPLPAAHLPPGSPRPARTCRRAACAAFSEAGRWLRPSLQGAAPAPRSPLPAPRPGPRGRAGGGPGRSRVADGSSPATAPRLSRPGFCPSGRQVPVPDTLAKAVPTLSLASV